MLPASWPDNSSDVVFLDDAPALRVPAEPAADSGAGHREAALRGGHATSGGVGAPALLSTSW